MTMLAARAHRDSDSVHLEQVSIPTPEDHEVVVKVVSAGLAPGMMKLLAMGAFKHLPTTLGHEAAGTIHAVGNSVDGLAVGTRVRVHPNLNCRNCIYCRTDRDMMCAQQAMIGFAAFSAVELPLYARYHDGALAEYIRVPHWLIDPLPDNVNFDVGAKVHDLANAMRILKVIDTPAASTVVITAATGNMGTATVALAERFGIGRLILVGRSAERLEPVAGLAGSVAVETIALEELGDDWESTNALTGRIRAMVPDGADAVVDYSPSGAASAQALTALATGGTLAHMGGSTAPLMIPLIAIMTNCWRLVGTRACTRNDAQEILRLLGAGTLDVDHLITHRFALSDTVRAITEMQTRTQPMWMTVVNP